MSKHITLRINDTTLTRIDSGRGLADRSKIINAILDYVTSQEGMVESFANSKNS